MTEEQIKQNAEAYADKAAPITEQKTGIPLAIHTAAEVAYIAGAHSRDEEIEKLRKHDALENKMRIDLINECEQLKQELNQLRNPWISVEERLPRKLRKKNYSKEVLCRTDGGTLLVSIYNYKKREWTDGIYIKITHWMSIPELKGGKV